MFPHFPQKWESWIYRFIVISKGQKGKGDTRRAWVICVRNKAYYNSHETSLEKSKYESAVSESGYSTFFLCITIF